MGYGEKNAFQRVVAEFPRKNELRNVSNVDFLQEVLKQSRCQKRNARNPSKIT